VSIEVSADILIDAMTATGPMGGECLVDEIVHTGGAGKSRVERWPVDGRLHKTEPGALWVWRVMHTPKAISMAARVLPTRIAYGVSQGGEAGACKAGRQAARWLAKDRRQAV